MEVQTPDAPEESEAPRVLTSMALRRAGAIPAELLSRHVLAVTAGADWAVARAALEALLRRWTFSQRDGLKVAARPRGGHPYGVYATRRRGHAERPYTTLLLALQPLRASCDCPDFLRSSLGACKHLLVALDDLASHPRRLAAALQDPDGDGAGRPALAWDPVRPLTGPGDWLERVRLAPDAARRGGAWAKLAARRFRPGSDGLLPLRAAFPDRPDLRLELVEELLERVQCGTHRGASVPAGEPALRPLLQEEAARLRRTAALRGARGRLRGALRSTKRRLYRYQREGVERFLASGRLVLADDMGLGKTLQAAAACHALFAAGAVRRGLLIVPASLKEQWRQEWQISTSAPVALVEGGAAERRRTYRATSRGFLIANYEQVLRDLDAIQAWKPGVVVLDEAQRIKNWATKTAACVKALDPPWRLVLTGTPMENRLDELASILDWVDDLALEPKWRLVPWHAQLADGKRDVVGARHLGTLRQRLEGCLLRRLRSEVLAQLPARTDTRVPVELTEAQAEEHDALDQPIAVLLRRARERPLTQPEFLRLMALLTTQRIVSNGLAQLDFENVWPSLERRRASRRLLESLSSPKLLELRELVEQAAVGQRRKLVVFSQWRRMLTLAHWAVSDVLSGAGLRAAFFTGQERQRRRTQNLVDFHDDPACTVLFSTDAGGVGLNLQRAASCCVNLELPWNPAVLEQRIGRIHRPGQRRPIDVYNLVSASGIESRIAGLVAGKRALFTGLFDGDRDEVHFEHAGSFLSRLETVLEPATLPAPVRSRDTDEADPAEERELEALVAAADEAADQPPGSEPAASEPAGGPALSTDDLRHVLSQLQVRPKPDGGLTIDAAPEAASGLIALFEGLASMLRRSGG
jgi:superfamily II DNA or RNA helicase